MGMGTALGSRQDPAGLTSLWPWTPGSPCLSLRAGICSVLQRVVITLTLHGALRMQEGGSPGSCCQGLLDLAGLGGRQQARHHKCFNGGSACCQGNAEQGQPAQGWPGCWVDSPYIHPLLLSHLRRAWGRTGGQGGAGSLGVQGAGLLNNLGSRDPQELGWECSLHIACLSSG